MNASRDARFVPTTAARPKSLSFRSALRALGFLFHEISYVALSCSVPNLGKICEALGLSKSGARRALKQRTELKLRPEGFAANTEFMPTAADLLLDDDDFNEKLRPISYTISKLCEIMKKMYNCMSGPVWACHT